MVSDGIIIDLLNFKLAFTCYAVKNYFFKFPDFSRKIYEVVLKAPVKQSSAKQAGIFLESSFYKPFTTCETVGLDGSN